MRPIRIKPNERKVSFLAMPLLCSASGLARKYFLRTPLPLVTGEGVFHLKGNPPAMPVVARGREKALAAASVSIQKNSGVLN